MATVSYGTITVTDLTDITDVYLEYCMTEAGLTASQVEAKITWTAPEREWGTTYPTWQSGYEIWIRQVQIKEGIEEPEYGTPYLDNAVNQINSDLEDINITINTTEANLEALQSKLGKIWRNESERLYNHWYDEDHNSSTPSIQWTKPDYPAGTYAASGTVEFNLYTGNTSGNPSQRRLYELNESNEYVLTSDSSFVSGKSYYVRTITIDTEDSSTYKYNTYLSHNKLALRYNAIDMTTLTTNALTFYTPTQDSNENWIQGEKGLEITAEGIDIYGPNNIKGLDIRSDGLIIYDADVVPVISAKQNIFSLGFDTNKYTNDTNGFNPFDPDNLDPFIVWTKNQNENQEIYTLYICADDILLKDNSIKYSLKNKLSEIDNNISNINTTINNIQTDINLIQTDVLQLKNDVSVNQLNILDNTTRINKIQAYWKINNNNHLTLAEEAI